MKNRILMFLVAVLSMVVMVVVVPNHAIAGELGNSTMYWGNSGWQVANLQNDLKKLGYDPGTSDGVFGARTWTAVKAFQKDYGLQVDGIVGPQTKQVLEGVIARKARDNALTTSRGSNISRSDLDLLAKAVYSEARGESYEGQVAIAAVILNRVASPDFPDTISGVIFQPWAFTAVNDGQFWLTPDQTAYKAAQDAVNGWDPTGGALYYYNPAKTTNKWIWSRPVIKTIGSHVFAK